MSGGEAVPGVTGEPDVLGERFLVEVLQSLVRTPSVNPKDGEGAMATAVVSWLRQTPAEITIIETRPGRPSVAAILEGAPAGPRLVLNGHMDTVAVDDASRWSSDPFGAEVRDGYVYGRGACDMKGGLAVEIAVLHWLSRRLDRLNGALVAHFAMGEELGEPGTLSLLEAGFGGDYGITTEPTELCVATAARGLAFYRVEIRGRSIHASRAEEGANPIDLVPAVLRALDEYRLEVVRRTHPLLPPPSCTPTVIRAGVQANSVPDSCEIVVDRRLLPGETADGELNAIRRRLEALEGLQPGLNLDVELLPGAFAPAEIERDSRFARDVSDAVKAVTGEARPIVGTSFASDVRNLINDAGIEAVTFGPGNVSECHCADERVSIRDLRIAAEATARVASDLLLS